MNRDVQVQIACSEHDNEVMGIFYFLLFHSHAQIRDILVLLILGKIKCKSVHAAKKP